MGRLNETSRRRLREPADADIAKAAISGGATGYCHWVPVIANDANIQVRLNSPRLECLQDLLLPDPEVMELFSVQSGCLVSR